MAQLVDRTFFSETMRTMYRIYGYETVMKEILFLHHVEQQSPSIRVAPVEVNEPAPVETNPVYVKRPVVKSTELPSVTVHKVDAEVEEDDDDEKVQEELTPLQNKKGVRNIKYARAILKEEEQCTSVTGKGVRCSIRRTGSALYCLRHVKKQDQDQKQDREKEENQEEDSVS